MEIQIEHEWKNRTILKSTFWTVTLESQYNGKRHNRLCFCLGAVPSNPLIVDNRVYRSCIKNNSSKKCRRYFHCCYLMIKLKIGAGFRLDTEWNLKSRKVPGNKIYWETGTGKVENFFPAPFKSCTGLARFSLFRLKMDEITKVKQL